MDDKKPLLASVLIAAGCLALVGALIWAGHTNVSVSVMGGDGKPVVVQAGEQSKGVFGAAAGDTTNWTAGAFSSDLSVGGTLATTGNATFSGNATITGTSTLSGEVSGVPKSLSQTITNATTTACTFQNNSGVTRVVAGAVVVDRGMAASSTGVVAWSAGTSTASGANGASTLSFTKVINTVLTRLNGVDVVTPTSSVMGTGAAYSTWENGSYFNFISGTTTNQGTCKVIYF